MLEYIRSRAQGVFAWLIVGAIILTFALFGINQYLSGGGDSSVATVDGAEISRMQLEQAYGQQRQRLVQMFGGKLPAMFTEKMLKQQALSQLVTKEVLVQAAYGNGIRIGDLQLAEIIRSAEVFHEDGSFSRSRYEQLLAQQGMSPGMFEAQVRRDMLAAQFESGYRDSSFVTTAEVDNLLRLQKQQRAVGYLNIALAPFSKAATVGDEEVTDYYQSNQSSFMRPERVKIDYLELDLQALADAVTVTDAELRSRYEARKINYSTPQERRASHILIKVDENAPQSDVEAAREKAEALVSRIRAGEDFAELARENSDDPGSAKQGGDLGFFGRGAMVMEFEEAAFALQEGEVSEPVRSPFGFHIIKLTGIRGGEVKPFEAVKADIRKEIQNEQAEQRFYDMAEQLANLTYEHPESLQTASEVLGVAIKTSDYFTRQGGSGIAANPKITGAAFSEDVLVRGNNSETIELDRNRLVVLRVNDHQPEMVRPLDEVKASITATLKQNKASAEAEKLAASLLERLRAGEKPKALAAADGVTWQEKQTLLRDSDTTDPAILSTAFRLPEPQQGGFSSDTVTLSSGDLAVVVLYAVTDGDPESASEQERNMAEAQLLRATTDATSGAVMAGIRSRMDITIKQ